MKYSIAVRLFIAALLLIAAFTDGLPYGYFQFLRYSAFLGFAWLAYFEIIEKRAIMGVVAIASAILFNPLEKIRLQRSEWEKVDAIVGILLVLWLLIGALVYLFKIGRSNPRKRQQRE